jgi:TIR domain
MSRCTAPVRGHRTASAAAACPACGSRSYYRSPSYYTPPTRPYWSGGGASSGGGSSSGGSSSGGRSRRLRGGGAVSYTSAEWRTIEPLARQAEEQAREHPERRDLFLCHAWDDRQGAARELCDLLLSLGVTVWFSEKDVGLGKSLLREIDKGLANSRIGIVLVTPALLKALAAEGIADKELSALLATDRVIPVTHGTTFVALRDISPLLAARSGLSTGDSSMRDVATKVAAAAAAENDS